MKAPPSSFLKWTCFKQIVIVRFAANNARQFVSFFPVAICQVVAQVFLLISILYLLSYTCIDSRIRVIYCIIYLIVLGSGNDI